MVFSCSDSALICTRIGAQDYAGGTAVHINAGVAGLVLALIIGRRVGWPRDPARPHNLTLTMLGAGLLWVGWYGFNVGSIVFGDDWSTKAGAAANSAQFLSETGRTFANTTLATMAAMLAWLLAERILHGKATSLGAASGVVAGLVAITPSCSSVTPIGAIFIGLIAGVLCALAVGLKYKLGYDDSLDVVGVHLVGGLWGTISVGFFASAATTAGIDGLFYGGGVDQLWRQVVGALAVLLYSFILTFIIGTVIQKTMGFRITEEDEVAGIDSVEHAETAYDFASLGGSGGGATSLVGQAHAEARNTEGVRA
jgi:Amt family ammonium transporter